MNPSQPTSDSDRFGQHNATFRISVFDGEQKTFNFGCAGVAHLIYVERRSAGHVFIEQTSVVIRLDLLKKSIFRHVTSKLVDIKLDVFAVTRKIAVLKRLLMREQLVVHFPEFSLSCGTGSQRMRMSFHGWKVSKDKAQIFTQPFLHFLDYRISSTAMNTFKVAVFEQRHRRIYRDGTVG